MTSRRAFLKTAAAAGVALSIPSRLPADSTTRVIPSTGERISAIGLGSWITFDVGGAGPRRDNCRKVMRAFFERGGQMIDSSPMYGAAQAVIGESLDQLDNDDQLFSATKVWIPGRSTGLMQTENALKTWRQDHFDLLHVHNLLDWDAHLPWMQEWKQRGRIRYTGVTTSHGRRHREMEQVLKEQPVDFTQFTYNIRYREAEERLLPVAQDHGRAVVINRPFDGGRLFDDVEGKPLPPWADEIQCENWAQFFLKFVVSHPAVTCAIPATSQVSHLHENMGALAGSLPDQAMREEMVRYFGRVAG